MCIHFFESTEAIIESAFDEAEVIDQTAWSLVARMPDGSDQRFSAGIIRRDSDNRLVLSLLNHQYPGVGIVQWVGSDDSEEASADLDYAVSFLTKVVEEYEKPPTLEDRFLSLLSGVPAFFAQAVLAYPGFEPVAPDDVQPTPEGFGSAG